MRFILGFIGVVFAGILAISLISSGLDYFNNPPEETAQHKLHKHPKDLHLASDGAFGKFDNAQLQRGFQVYTEVCAACHALERVSFRDLHALGYSEAEIKKIASDWKTQVPSINPDTGEVAGRKALPSDRFPSPFANETAARAANNNAYPPDLSLITKSREGGAAYIYSLLTGYQNQSPALVKEFPDAKTPAGLHYNPYFANLNIAMPPPLTSNGQVTYADGTPATVDQMAKDVSAFLVWAGEPKLDSRRASGLAVTIFLLIASILGYLAYRQTWHQVKRGVRVTGALDPENQAKSRHAKADAGIAG
ncbi:MAG TPA: cytochrome c1 [Sphingomicrobium sp.]|jgi:ubiquinol-cytochrome c reductase cytochrome c1 subunit